MKEMNAKLVVSLVVLSAAVFSTGCETIVRENIISSIDTGIGASVTENKQTQLYELKAGYIHSQFYSIPTGKLVSNKNGSANDTKTVTSNKGGATDARYSNAANVTPEMVSGIKASTSLADVVLGLNVAENFAVGEAAVNSTAAIAMYISDAKNTNNANAAANAITGSTNKYAPDNSSALLQAYWTPKVSGTVTTAASSAAVTGTGTKFKTEVAVGDQIAVASDLRKVTTITDDTHLTAAASFSVMGNTAQYTIYSAQHQNAVQSWLVSNGMQKEDIEMLMISDLMADARKKAVQDLKLQPQK
jgi:hypothetical protein